MQSKNKSYRVFTGAPPAILFQKSNGTSWRTISSRELSPPFPPATLQLADERISLLCKNVTFEEDEEEQEDESEEWGSFHSRSLATQSIELSARSVHSITGVSSHLEETYDTQETGDNTTMFSEGSSISRFPTFTFNLHALASLSSLNHARRAGMGSTKVTLLLGVLEVDGPSYVTVKIGAHAGSEVGLLKLTVGDENSCVCKITVWRETAEVWGGASTEPGLKRGDIVLFENVLVAGPARQEEPSWRENDPRIQITASPNLKSQAQICYRTLPQTHEDRRLRPDLRLADSVPVVRKVTEVVIWMERMAGISMK